MHHARPARDVAHARGAERSRLSRAQADDVLGTAFSDATGLMLRGAVEQQLLTALAAGIARFEAEVAPGIAADAQPDRSLDDLRLATPALRPVGCWWSGCAPPPNIGYRVGRV